MTKEPSDKLKLKSQQKLIDHIEVALSIAQTNLLTLRKTTDVWEKRYLSIRTRALLLAISNFIAIAYIIKMWLD